MQPKPALGGLAQELLELQATIRANTLAGPSTSTALSRKILPVGAPAFGDVYFGSLGPFACGEPHYGMVTGRSRGGASVCLAPITDGKKRRRKPESVMILPPKTLPPKKTEMAIEFIPSHVLLKIRIEVTLEQIRDSRQFRYTDRLGPNYRNEAREKLARMRLE